MHGARVTIRRLRVTNKGYVLPLGVGLGVGLGVPSRVQRVRSISPLHLRCISAVSPLYLAYISRYVLRELSAAELSDPTTAELCRMRGFTYDEAEVGLGFGLGLGSGLV